MNKITQEQIKILGDKAWLFNIDKWWELLEYFNIEQIQDLDSDKFEDVIKYIDEFNRMVDYYEDIACSKD